MEDWSDYRVFLAACRAGSLSRTAVELGISVSTASRRISALEDALGAVLFARTPTGLEPTPAAHSLRPHAEAVERAAHAATAAVESLDPTPVGRVSIALPADMLLLVVLPLLGDFIEAHPHLNLRFDSSSRVADLNRREADLAVRIQRPADGNDLIATRLRTVSWAPFCRAEVLQSLEDPADPQQHRWIGSSRPTPIKSFVDHLCQGRYALQFSDAVGVRHAVQAGLGTALIPRIFARAVPGLVEVEFRDMPPAPSIQLQLITHRAVRHSPRVAAVWNMLLELLRDDGDGAEPPPRMRKALSAYGF